MNGRPGWLDPNASTHVCGAVHDLSPVWGHGGAATVRAVHNQGVTTGEDTITTARARRGGTAAWLVVVLYCWLAGTFASFTWQSTAAVLIPGITIFALGIARPPDRRPRPAPIGITGAVAWSIPLLTFCVLEIVDDLLGSTHAHPTLSILMDPVLNVHVWRSMGYFVWIIVGWALVKR